MIKSLQVIFPRRFKSVPLHGVSWVVIRIRRKEISAPGAVLGETGRPSAVLSDDFLEGSTGGMVDGRKKVKEFKPFIPMPPSG
jgi:hypothetical protein